MSLLFSFEDVLVTKHCDVCHRIDLLPMSQRVCACGGNVFLFNRSIGCKDCK